MSPAPSASQQSQRIEKQNQSNSELFFDTQLKTALSRILLGPIVNNHDGVFVSKGVHKEIEAWQSWLIESKTSKEYKTLMWKQSFKRFLGYSRVGDLFTLWVSARSLDVPLPSCYFNWQRIHKRQLNFKLIANSGWTTSDLTEESQSKILLAGFFNANATFFLPRELLWASPKSQYERVRWDFVHWLFLIHS